MNTKCICIHHKHFSGKLETENQVIFPGDPPFRITLTVVQYVECTKGAVGTQGTDALTQTGPNSWTIEYLDHPQVGKCDCKNDGDMRCNCEETLTISHNGGYASGWGKDLVTGGTSGDNTLVKRALDQAAEEAWGKCPVGIGSPKDCCKLMKGDKFGK